MRIILFIFATLFLYGLDAQHARYRYNLKLLEDEKSIRGEGNISFINQSSHHIDTLYLHLPPRSLESKYSFLNKQFAEFQNVNLYYADRDETGYIILDNLEVRGQEFEVCTHCEFVKLPLSEALKPQDSLNVNYRFLIKFPEAHWLGVGHDENSFRLIDWLPQIPSFDSSGFHLYPVTWQRDVYPSQSYYDVKLEVPKSHLVASNARLLTESEITLRDSLKKNPFQKVGNHPGTKKLDYKHFGTNLQFIISSDFYLFPLGKTNTLFVFRDNPFIASIVDTANNRISKFFRTELGEDLVHDYDLVLLDNKVSEYQSDHLLTLNYPKNVFELSRELVQAKAESLFRYRLSPDGFKNVWLARGIPYFYKYQYIRRYYPEEKWVPFISDTWLGKFFSLNEFDYSYQNHFLFLYLARKGLDQKMATPADSLTRLNYEAIAQAKTSLAVNHLQNYTGLRGFRRAMRDFVLENRNGYATPESLKAKFAYYVHRDVNWFFETWIHSSEIYDYQLEDLDYCPTITTASIDNKGRLALPYSLTGLKDGEPVLTEWFKGHQDKKTVQMHHANYDKVVLNYDDHNAEVSQKNNTYYNRLLFPRTEPVKFQFYQTFEDPHKSQLFWMPSAGFNAYDKLLLGISLYNKGPVDKKWEYVLGPEYSFGQKQLAGYGSLLYNYVPKESSIFHRISAGLFTRYYHYDEDLAYFRISPGINFYFRKPYPKSTILHRLRARTVHVERELDDSFEGVANEISNASYSIFNLNYKFEETDIFAPFTLQSDLLVGNQFSRISLEGDFRWMMPNKKWLIWRNFGGYFLSNRFAEIGEDQNYYSLGLSGTQDFLFDYTFIGRSEESGIWSRQFFISDGGFKSETGVFADRWMFTTNLSVPIWSVVGVFGDMGFADGFDRFYYDYGARLALLTDFAEVYFPFGNQDRNFLKEENYAQNIRFVLVVDLSDIVHRLRRGYY